MMNDSNLIQFDNFESSHNNPSVVQANDSPNQQVPVQNEIVPPPKPSRSSWFSRVTCGKFDSREPELVLPSQDQSKEKVEEPVSPAGNQGLEIDIPSPPVEAVNPPDSNRSNIKSTDRASASGNPDKFNWSAFMVSFIIGFLYYASFVSNLFTAYYLLFMQNNMPLGIVVVSIIGVNHLIRICFLIFLEDEWVGQLPYIDSSAGNSFRVFLIYIAMFFNLDTPYWLHQIYANGKRDGEIEYILCLARTSQILLEHLPILYLTTFLFIQVLILIQTQKKGNEFNYFWWPAIISNLLNSVVLMYGVNFFNAESLDTIKWCFLRVLELWSKVSIFAFVLNIFMLPENMLFTYYLGATCVAVTTIWFVMFNDFKNDSVSGSISTFLMLFAKLVAVFSFKEISYGFDRIDTESQPNLYVMKYDNRLQTQNSIYFPSNAKLTYTINFIFYVQMAYLGWLWGGWPILLSSQFQQIVVGSGAGSFLITSLYYVYFVKGLSDPDSYANMDPDDQ